MKSYRILPLLLAAMLVMSYDFPISIVYADTLEELPENIADEDTTEDFAPEPLSVSENHIAILSDNDSSKIADEKPSLSVSVEKSYSGYIVKGYTDFIPDMALVQPQYSLDGENWQDCGDDWNLFYLEDPEHPDSLHNQLCLYDSYEPLKSYIAGELDCFYLRLSITMADGTAYETQTAVIEREAPMPVPEEITYTAGFALSMMSRQTDSSGAYIYCGKYQLTVNTSASSEDISALLPDTLPVKVDLHKDGQAYADCTIDCPVAWKSISLSGLTAGESITLQDAAEEIVIPAGTPLCTPMGTYTLDESLSIASEFWMSDEVVLVLNVVSDGAAPTGVLSGSIHGLEMAFDLKPTGATAIRAYTLTDGDSEWKEITGLPLLEAVNAQPSTANSGYTTLLSRDQEPFQSCLAAEYAGEDPAPFLVGLTIEGGIYNGCQLILSYPDTYDFPPDLRVGGAGGNQGNAGIGSRNDSTEEGQRPDLPQNPVEQTEKPAPSNIIPDTTDSSGNLTDNTGNLQTNTEKTPAGNAGNLQTDTSENTTEHTGNLLTNTSAIQTDDFGRQQMNPETVSVQNSSDTSTHLSAGTQAATDDPKKDSPLKPLLPVAAASIAGIYITITAAKVITGIKAGRIIKKP